MKRINCAVDTQDSGKRLDAFLAEKQSQLTRSQVQKAIRDGRVRVERIPQKAAYHVQSGELVELEISDPIPADSKPEAIQLDIIYEDSALVVVNKPAGMVVHPACGNYTGTLVNALLHHCTELSGIGGVLRPGIVHRLDKGTSGILVVAKNDCAHQGLSRQFKDHTITRRYRALVYGSMDKPAGTIETLIGRHPQHRQKMSTAPKRGRAAVTHWKVKELFTAVTLLEVTLETGRTHQVRVHLASIGHPVVGDELYGSARRLREIRSQRLRDILKGIGRPMLHAGYLRFVHPEKLVAMEFEAPLPADFMHIVQAVRAEG